MSKKLVWLAVAMIAAGACAALVLNSSDSKPMRIALAKWERGDESAAASRSGLFFGQDAPGGGGAVSGGATPVEGAAVDEAPTDGAGAGKANSSEDMMKQLEAWTAQDPRDIITKKYEDLEGKETAPWDEENPDTFIADTGRNDPLTPVRNALPEALRPPRSGDDEENEILGYYLAQFATQAVDAVMSQLQVYNMVQIGLRKIVTMGVPGGTSFTAEEGEAFDFDMGLGGVFVTVFVSVDSVKQDDITVSISAVAAGSQERITKVAHYIPGSPSSTISQGDGGDNGGQGGGGRGRGRGRG
jgi:hypothetical protein